MVEEVMFNKQNAIFSQRENEAVTEQMAELTNRRILCGGKD